MGKYLQFLSGGGEMGTLMRAYNWQASPIEAADKWPQSLLTTLSILLNSKFPLFLFWGPHHICFYNDAYRPILGNEGKHPFMLGMKGQEAWPEIWHIIKPLLDEVLTNGQATWNEDQLFPIYRNGKMEDVYWTLSYSPVKDETGLTAGVFVTCTETTDKINNQKKIAESNSQLELAVKALETSESKFRSLILQAPIAMSVIMGLDFSIEIVNKKQLELWQKEEADILHKPLFAVFPEVKSQEVERMLTDVYITGIPFTGKEIATQLFRNGILETAYFDITYEPLRSQPGEVEGIIVTSYEATEAVTARKIIEANERQLELERKSLHDFLTQAPAMLAILKGPEHVFEFANPAYMELIGNRDIINKSLLEALPEIAGQGFSEMLDNVYKTGETFTGKETPVMLNKGSDKLESIFMNFSYQAFANDKGETEGILVFAYDVSEQVIARKQIEASETSMRLMASHLKLATDSANAGTWSLDMKTQKVKWSPLHNRMWGYNEYRTDITFEDWHKLILPEDKERAFEKLEEAKVNNTTYEADYRINRANDGELRYMRSVGKYYYNDKGEVDTLTGISIDITEQKIAEEQVRQSEEKFKSIFDNSLAAILVTNDQGNYLSANKAAGNLLGYPVKELLGMNVGDLKTTVKDGAAKRFEEYIRRGEDTGEFDFITKSGARKFGQYQAIRLKADFNLSIMMDITDQKDATLKLKASEEKYHGLFKTMDQGFCIIEMIFDSANKPVDYLFIEANPMFEKHGGTGNPVGKTIRELVPNMEERWFEIYGKVALTGEANHFIEQSEGLNRWFEVYAFRLEDQEGKNVAVLFTDITEQKLSEEKIRKSEERFRSLAESSPDMIVRMDKELRYVYVSPHIEKFTNKKAEEFIGKTPKELGFPEEFIVFIEEQIAFVVEKKHLHEVEFLGLNGENISTRVVPELDELGDVISFLIVTTDITERKLAEDRIKSSENEFRTFADSIQNLAWIADGEGSIYWYNQRWLDYTGLSLEEMKGWGWQKVHHPDHVERIVNLSKDLWKKDEAFELTFPLRRHDGEYRWFLTRAYPVIDTNGNIERWIGTNTDITDQKSFSEELERKVNERTKELQVQNQTFQQAEDIAKFGSYKLEVATGALEYTDNLFRLLDCQPQEFVPSNEKFLSFVHPEDLQEVINNGKKAIQTDILIEVSYRIISKTGQIKHFRSSGKYTGEGDHILFIGTVQDISKDVIMAEALRTKNLELENINADLTSFNYVASHDLQEPLRKIQTFGKLILKREKFSDKTQDYFNRMIAAGERMQNLIVSLLEFSKASVTEVIFEPCDLNEIVAESLNDLQLSISEKQAIIENGNLPTINGSPIQLSQLFTNLIDNAIKYSRPEIKPTIKIAASIVDGKEIGCSSATQKEYHVIKIADNGIGFEKEYATKIFTIFQRLHGKQEYSGTGIGLAIVKKIVANHNGFIVAEGAPGIGSTFTIYIPLT